MTDVVVTGPTPVLTDPPAVLTPATIVDPPASVAIADATIQLPAAVGPGDSVTVMIGTAKVKLLGPNPVPPPSGWAGKPAFGSYPLMAQQNYTSWPDGTKTITISGKTFRGNIGTSNAALRFQYLKGGTITITDCDFDHLTWSAINLIECDVTVKIEWCRFSEVTRNYFQASNGTILRSSYLRNCKGKGGLTEDMVNLNAAGGPSAADPFVIEHNAFEGVDWTSGSGSGIALGDGGASHAIARFNTLLSPGQVGAFISEGVDNHLTDNIVYGAKRPNSNVGIYGPYIGGAANPGGHEIARNRVFWLNAAGSPNPQFSTTGSTSGTIAGISPQTNVWQDTTIDPATLAVTL